MVKSWGIRAYKYENLAPSEFDAKVMRQQFANRQQDPPIALIVVRGYLNWLASASVLSWRRVNRDPQDSEYEQRAKEMIRREYLSRLVDSWVDLYREAIGETHYLDRGIPVRYGRFKADRVYREGICGRLGGEYSEAQLDFVPVNGGGSSFDGMQMMDCGSAMSTDRRHLEVLDHPAADLYRWALETHQTALNLWTGEEKEM